MNSDQPLIIFDKEVEKKLFTSLDIETHGLDLSLMNQMAEEFFKNIAHFRDDGPMEETI